MRLNKSDRPALIIVDIQKGFLDLAYWGGQRNNPDAEKNAAKLLELWRENGLPVFHIQHCSSNPGSILAPGNPGNDFQDLVRPVAGEPVIRKNVNSAFIGTSLEQQLDEQGITHVVITGLTTDHCVSTTTRMAANLGYETFIVHDATATFCKKGWDQQEYKAEWIHDTALASLNGEFATVVSTQQLLHAFADKKEFLSERS